MIATGDSSEGLGIFFWTTFIAGYVGSLTIAQKEKIHDGKQCGATLHNRRLDPRFGYGSGVGPVCVCEG
jgi:hypothetical protein